MGILSYCEKEAQEWKKHSFFRIHRSRRISQDDLSEPERERI